MDFWLFLVMNNILCNNQEFCEEGFLFPGAIN